MAGLAAVDEQEMQQRNGGGGKAPALHNSADEHVDSECGEASGSDNEDGAAAAPVDPAAVSASLDAHLLPWLFGIGLLCYLDRTNLSFAALELNRDLGLSCADYGLGAGLFFISYAVGQLPSNMACVRLGAPLWLGATVAVWGVVAAGFAAVSTRAAFLALRLALGLAECGAFPGMWWHLSLFYTPSELGQAYSKAAASGALAQVIGGPLAAALLSLDGVGGMRGWQWLFLVEGVPTILFGIALRVRLAPSPDRAMFLSREERRWLARRQEAAAKSSGGGGHAPLTFRAQLCGLASVVRDWRVLYLGGAWLLVAATMYGIIFWGPLLIASMLGGDRSSSGGSGCAGSGHGGGASTAASQSPALVALLSAVPFAVAAAGMVLNARLAEQANERHRHAGVPLVLGGVALGAVPAAMGAALPAAAFCCLVLAAGLVWSFHGPFMSWPSILLPHGPQAAAGFAFINVFGSVGGFLGPFAIGLLADSGAGGAGGYSTAMLALAACLLAAGTAILLFPVPGCAPVVPKEAELACTAAAAMASSASRTSDEGVPILTSQRVRSGGMDDLPRP